MTCPGGYQSAAGNTCTIVCPPDFKYIQEGGTQKCVYITDNTKYVVINSLPVPTDANNIPEPFARETSRVALELLNIRNRLASESDTQLSLESAQAQGRLWQSQYGAIQSDFASYESDADKLREVADSLKPLRPPTAPAEDLEKERKAVSAVFQKNYLVIQISLFLVFLVLLVYVILPVQYAHFIAFFLLISGVMIGIFLRK